MKKYDLMAIKIWFIKEGKLNLTVLLRLRVYSVVLYYYYYPIHDGEISILSTCHLSIFLGNIKIQMTCSYWCYFEIIWSKCNYFWQC